MFSIGQIERKLGQALKGALPFAVVSNKAEGFIGRAICYPEMQKALDAGEKLIFVQASAKNYQSFNLTSSHDNVVIISSWGACFKSPESDGVTTDYAIDMQGITGAVLIGLKGNSKHDATSTYAAIKCSSASSRVFLFGCYAENSDNEGFDTVSLTDSMLIGCLAGDTNSAKPPFASTANYTGLIGCIDDGNHNGNPFNLQGKGLVVGCIETGSGYGAWNSGADNLMVGCMVNGAPGGGTTSSTIANNEQY
tara:strand:- start:3481 stop:4233 length:753 start_codon:yes stop_codon:yes gene_type:complete